MIKYCVIYGLIIGCIIFSGCTENKQIYEESEDPIVPIVITQTECIMPMESELGLVDVIVFDWFVNEYDESEILFDFNVYNYGYSEAKDIKIKCMLFDDKDNVLTSSIYNFGNIASNSYVFDESTTQYDTNPDSYYSAVCYIDSCENCEILNSRIPALIEEINNW